MGKPYACEIKVFMEYYVPNGQFLCIGFRVHVSVARGCQTWILFVTTDKACLDILVSKLTSFFNYFAIYLLLSTYGQL